jgi:hypothetical protein
MIKKINKHKELLKRAKQTRLEMYRIDSQLTGELIKF